MTPAMTVDLTRGWSAPATPRLWPARRRNLVAERRQAGQPKQPPSGTMRDLNGDAIGMKLSSSWSAFSSPSRGLAASDAAESTRRGEQIDSDGGPRVPPVAERNWDEAISKRCRQVFCAAPIRRMPPTATTPSCLRRRGFARHPNSNENRNRHVRRAGGHPSGWTRQVGASPGAGLT